jgi:tight adherence protein C
VDWQHIFISLNALIAVSSAVLLVVHLLTRQHRQVQDRLDDLSGAKQPGVLRGRFRERRKTPRSPSKLSAWGAKLLPGSEAEQARMQRRLLYAGIYSPSAASTYAAVRLAIAIFAPLAGVAAGLFGWCSLRHGFVGGLLLGGAGCFLASLWLDRRKAQRQSMLRNALPDFLDLISTCLESGLSFEAALQRVSDELRTAYPLLAGEMSVVQREIEFGKSPDEALRNFAERSDLDVLRTLSTFVEQSRRFGSSMVETLRTHSDMLRTQQEQRAEEAAQRAAVKILFPTLLFIFPPILVVLAGPAAIQLQEKFTGDPQKQEKVEP